MFTYPITFWKPSAGGILVPEGLIIPYNDTAAPDGWTLFTSADGKFIVGAGNTYAVGATGGNTSLTTGNSNTQGAHTGTTGYVGNATTYPYRGETSAGGHTHTLTYNYTPPYQGLRLIQANTQLAKLPAKAIMFSGETLSDLSIYSTGDGKLFRANATITSGGSNTISAGATSSSAGAHSHGTGNSIGTGSLFEYCVSAGAHTHLNAQFVITPNLRRTLLSAWTDASVAFSLQTGMYAFWESTVDLPDGWLLCDGDNDTLDLRDYFVQFTNEVDDGTRTGDATISVPNITLSNDANAHYHIIEASYYSSVSGLHVNYTNTHGHAIATSSPAFLPQYYSLAIIKLAA